MAAVFVHGIPDTFHMWRDITKRLKRKDVITLALPGFGVPIPIGFKSTKEEFVEWIIKELEKIGSPVDLVGHDWGCIFTARVASIRPDLVRTWAGGSGPISKQYPWHDLALTWQTEGKGEKWMEDLDPNQFSLSIQEFRVPKEYADESVTRIDSLMKESILKLYRSAVNLGQDWEADLIKVRSPSLLIWGIQDIHAPASYSDLMGEFMKADILKLNGSHWAPLYRPEEFVRALETHWTLANV